jgi:hypothetical protein
MRFELATLRDHISHRPRAAALVAEGPAGEFRTVPDSSGQSACYDLERWAAAAAEAIRRPCLTITVFKNVAP